MKDTTIVGLGVGLGALAIGTLIAREVFAGEPTAQRPETVPNVEPTYDFDLPEASELTSDADLETNWGETPEELRPLFMRMEEVSGIEGAGRIYSVIAYGESRWQNDAQNDDAHEVDASTRALKNGLGRGNPTLKYGDEAAAFGSGGYFGALAPYYLWIGVPTVGKRAPFLDHHPKSMFSPRNAAFHAMYYLYRLIRVNLYTLRDHLDIKAGWAAPALITKSRLDSEKTLGIRAKFSQHAAEVGIDLNDTSTIPTVLSAARWPGALTAYNRITLQ